jgi:hypothetical protein
MRAEKYSRKGTVVNIGPITNAANSSTTQKTFRREMQDIRIGKPALEDEIAADHKKHLDRNFAQGAAKDREGLRQTHQREVMAKEDGERRQEPQCIKIIAMGRRHHGV